jgi:glycosyltransferase involved in cell wall biosynthesis
MRICHVSPHLPPDQAANAILPAELGGWSQARGHHVAFVSHMGAQGRSGAEPLAGPVHRVDGRRSSSAFVRTLRLDTWRRARAIVGALNAVAADADVLHLHSNGLIIEVAARWARRRRIPFVLTLYGTEIWHYRPRRPIDPFTRAYRTAGAVTFYSHGLLDRARELRLDRPGLSVIYPAVRPAFAPVPDAARARLRADLGIRERQVILNVKRLHPLAGQAYLLAAFAEVGRMRPDVRLVICGTGDLRGALEAQAAAAGIAGRVTFTGLVSNDTVARYAATADIFALPSLLEALPTVAVEALACETPVISADHPGGKELHTIFGDDVEIVPRQDASALAGRLHAALQRPRRTRGTTAGLIRERFSPAAVEAAYSLVYDEVTRAR